VLFASVHLHHAGFYPGPGEEGDVEGRKNVVSVPLKKGSGSAQFRLAVSSKLLPRCSRSCLRRRRSAD
jgi:acetoin utilization deacetylase AcuC-like enzyme